MKSSFMVASLIALGTVARAEDAAQTHRIEVTVEVTATHVTARNHGSDQQIFLFRSSEHGPVFARSLPPAGELAYTFPRHALAGVEIEVVSVHGRHLANSGAVPLGDAFADGVDALWFQSTPDGTFVWLERDGEFVAHQSTDTFVPKPLIQRDPELRNFRDLIAPSNATSNTHVPVVTPRDKPDEYGPPELEDKPLPPV